MDVYKNLINGAWVDSGNHLKNINPSDIRDVVGVASMGSEASLNEAVEAAKQAFKKWQVFNVQAKAEILEKIGWEIFDRRQELGELLSREEGKTLPEGIAEVVRAANIFKYYAGECLRLHGQKMASVRSDVEVEITREPIGVIGVITPWNFPIAIPAWKIAPALAYGNCVVFKPSEVTPALAFKLVEIAHRAGLPDGVLNLVFGTGDVVGNALVSHPHVNAITFTGSSAVGAVIAQQCAISHKKFQLEMGGKNPQIVLDDAELDLAVDVCVQSAFYSTGQRCTAASRIIVTQGVFAVFRQKIIERMRCLKVGDARSAGTDIGPIANAPQFERVNNYVQLGVQEGGILLSGGAAAVCHTGADKDGYYYKPALLQIEDAGLRVNQEEVFGPVATLMKANSYEEALQLANDTCYGLSAGIATSSLKLATHFKRHSQAGMVMVNLPTAGVDYHVPFGGIKNSSMGAREQGCHAKEFYTALKTAYIYA